MYIHKYAKNLPVIEISIFFHFENSITKNYRNLLIGNFINDLHFYSLKSISKLNLDYKNFQNHFQITKDFQNLKWKKEIFKMVSGGGYTFMVS